MAASAAGVYGGILGRAIESPDDQQELPPLGVGRVPRIHTFGYSSTEDA